MKPVPNKVYTAIAPMRSLLRVYKSVGHKQEGKIVTIQVQYPIKRPEF